MLLPRMDMDHEVMMADPMAMTFKNSWEGTPIVFKGWLPTAAGMYSPVSGAHFGSCLALIALAALYRGLHYWSMRFRDVERTRYLKTGKAILRAALSNARIAGLVDVEAGDDGEEGLAYVRDMPFNVRRETIRTVAAFVEAVAGYFLMLAAMTMVSSYFLSICAGIALGELCFGRIGSGAWVSLGSQRRNGPVATSAALGSVAINSCQCDAIEEIRIVGEEKH
ncbi:hypothetical protein PYCC9005_000446 [Savitreella phatthalungensis]